MAEAAVLLEAKTDPSSCFICSGMLTDPIGLPCQHGFCFECLDTWYNDSKPQTKVICPICKKSAAIPKDGIRGFPKYSLGDEDSKDVVDKKETTESKEVSCSLCSKSAEAHCVDYTKSLCPSCLNSHNLFMKDHHIVTTKELQSGQVTTEGRVCEVHGEQVRYYCETEDKQVCMDCISLKTCPIEHVRTTLKEAAKKQVVAIADLMTKCANNKKKFQDGIDETKSDMDALNKSTKQVKSELVRLKQQYIQKVEQLFDHQSSEVDTVHKYRVKVINRRKQALDAGISKMDTVCEEASNLITSGQDYLITHKFSSLSKNLDALSTAQPMVIGFIASYVKFEPMPMSVPPIGYLVRKNQWKLCDQFYTQGISAPQAIAINKDGEIAIASYQKGVVIYSSDNQVKRSFLQDPQSITGIVVSNDNRYIVSNGADLLGIQYFNKNGKRLSTIPVTDVQNKQCNLNSVAVDPQGRIVAGLVQNTVSIHYTNGELISKFSTTGHVYRLAITSKGDILISFLGKDSLELINYSGQSIKAIAPPPTVKKWAPGYVCCGKGEIFVVNESSGKPLGVFRYTADGDYLGCVTTDVTDPRGIALSQDGMELFVVERKDNQVKVFHRE
ncbi:E3 ubiquitin-protein ligase TRIM45-like [Amphiura filiformis]|uniref:E3 ubiquitin-protein ligase TRIM45-like n=1 Tax=Amphiura filiformis TaxID=82378 RepID=UPI003B2206D5